MMIARRRREAQTVKKMRYELKNNEPFTGSEPNNDGPLCIKGKKNKEKKICMKISRGKYIHP